MTSRGSEIDGREMVAMFGVWEVGGRSKRTKKQYEIHISRIFLKWSLRRVSTSGSNGSLAPRGVKGSDSPKPLMPIYVLIQIVAINQKIWGKQRYEINAVRDPTLISIHGIIDRNVSVISLSPLVGAIKEIVSLKLLIYPFWEPRFPEFNRSGIHSRVSGGKGDVLLRVPENQNLQKPVRVML